MRSRLAVLALLSFFSLAQESSARAEDLSGRWGLGAFLGGDFPLGGDFIQSHGDSGAAESAFIRYGVTPNWSPALAYDHLSFGHGLRLNDTTLGGVYSFTPDKRWTPEILGGIGLGQGQGSISGNNFALRVGLGLEYFLTYYYSVSAQALYHLVADTGNADNTSHAVSVGVALTAYFDAPPQKVIVVPPPPGPPDVTVTVSPERTALMPAATQQFTAQVTGGPTAVVWSLNPDSGTLNADGYYIAPPFIPAAMPVAVTAVSTANPSRMAIAVVMLTPPPPVIVTVAPGQASLAPATTLQFTATVSGAPPGVRWSLEPQIGALSPDGLYTAPALLDAAQTVTVKAVSASDPSKSASVSVALQPNIRVAVAPLQTQLTPFATAQFTATVTGGSPAVIWSLDVAVGTVTAQGLYTAPAVVSSSTTVTVTAASTADPSRKSSASILLVPPTEIDLHVKFEPDSDVISPAYTDDIKRVATFLRQYPGYHAEIQGHTDATGWLARNMRLSQSRADNVRKFLLETFSVDPAIVTSVGYGPTRPLADNTTAEGRAENRRVVVVFSRP